MKMCVFEDAGVALLQPLTLTRPAFDLRCGATTLLEKQRRYFAATATAARVRPEMTSLCRRTHPDLSVNDLPGGDADLVVLVNARWLAPGGACVSPGKPEIALVGDEIAWAALPADRLSGDLNRWRDELPHREAGGALITYPWDLVEHNAAALEDDFQSTRLPSSPLPAGVALLGSAERLRVDHAARVEPLVLIDTTKGPVMIDRGAVVQAFSRVEGPCYIGADTQLLAARVKGSSFGPQCRVGGEVESSIVHGHSNKAHDGFLGHSYVGEWVNLAVGTHTSDLRSDYGTVRFRLDGQDIDSGRMKVGSFVGDHTKTSLSALFNTGSLIGPFGLLLAPGTLLPRVLPPFCQVAHGQAAERTDLRQMFATAAAMMARRGREWTEDDAEFFFALYEATAGQRRQVLRDGEQRRLRRVV